MARRPVVHREELFEAANRLQAEGKAVTALSLLEAVGGGSLTTIYKCLNEWESSRPTASAATGNNEVPPAVTAAFVSTWKVAAAEAAREVQAAKEKAREEVQAAQQQFAGALEAIDKLEKESEVDAQQIESLKERVAQLEASLQKSQSESAAHKATAEQLRHQVKSQEAELERVHADLNKERDRYEQETAKLSGALTAAQEKATHQIESLRSTLAAAQGKADQLERERAEAHNKREEALKQLEKVEAASKADRAERDTAIKEAAELRGQVSSLKAQNSDLVGQLSKRMDKKSQG